MKNLYITGTGLVSEFISETKYLNQKGIEHFPALKNPMQLSDLVGKGYTFKSKNRVMREDGALLNKISHLAIDATVQAFQSTQYKENEKLNFPIYIANEAADHNLSSLDNLLSDHQTNVDYCLSHLGKLKNYLNPLDMLRLLSTNPLYHLSKIFQLQGGGYPVRRMSLSGLCALQEAWYQQPERALIVAVGDLTNPENLCAFQKMGLIKLKNNDNGIFPSYGAASLIVESETSLSNQAMIYARIRLIESSYKNDSNVSKQDWVGLFDRICHKTDVVDPCIILYDNGVSSLAQAERAAVKSMFPHASTFSYKKYLGYTGKANNLIDLIVALSDKRIPCGSDVLINGIGTSVGFGSILIEKINHV